jgi:hypothetical protein
VSASDEARVTFKVFWDWFVAHSKELLRIRSADSSEYVQLESMVADVDPGIGIEIGGGSGPTELQLIFTSHGVQDLFPIIDDLVAAAPPIKGWRVRALKPPLLEDFKLTYEGWSISAADIWVQLSKHVDQGTYDITVAVRCSSNMASSAELKDAAIIAVESYLGERAFATMIREWKFVNLPHDPPASEFIKLQDAARVLGVIRIQ